MRLFWICLSAVLATVISAASLPTPAKAQISIDRSPTTTNPVLGRVVRGTTATTFSISPTGVVARSGDAIRMSSSGVTATTVTISCGLLNLGCAGRTLRVTVQAAGATGSSTLTKFRVGSLTGTNYSTGSAPTEASSLTFNLTGIGLLGSCSFALGMDVLVPPTATPGNGTFSYTVTVTAL